MLVQTLPSAPLAIVAPVTQTRLYWVLLTRPVVDPEYGSMLETTSIDAEIVAGYIPEQGGGEIARLKTLIDADMPGWTIAGLQLADEPEVEF